MGLWRAPQAKALHARSDVHGGMGHNLSTWQQHRVPRAQSQHAGPGGGSVEPSGPKCHTQDSVEAMQGSQAQCWCLQTSPVPFIWPRRAKRFSIMALICQDTTSYLTKSLPISRVKGPLLYWKALCFKDRSTLKITFYT